MCLILKKVYDVDPNNSEAVKEAVTSFFQHLPKHKDVERHAWLRALESVICRFPKYCTSQRNNIEVYLSNYLDTNDYFEVIGAAKCTHAVQQVRQLSQDRIATAKTSWRSQINALCKAAHLLIDTVFENAVDMYKGVSENQTAASSYPFESALANITKVPNNENRKTFLLLRLRNILIFVQAMLVEVYPVPKQVEPQTVLDLVLRSQSVTSGAEITKELCAIKVEALRTLDALIDCLGSNLIPFSSLIIRFAMQTLRWSSEHPSDEASAVRCGAYRSLRGWLAVLRTHSPGTRSSWEEQFTEHVIRDITPPSKTVQLTIGPQPIKRLSKKARRKQANAMLKESSIAGHMPGEKSKTQSGEGVNNEVAMAALSCAEIFLTVCGRFLKPSTHKVQSLCDRMELGVFVYQERLIRECFSMDAYGEDQLLALLRVLEASRKTTPHRVAPPTQYCLHLYSVLLNRQIDAVTQFCTQALLDIRLHLHCSPPSLNFDLDVPEIEQMSTSKRKKVSDKNKAALEKLLGKDRVSQLDDEIIEPDGPLSKKPRIDADAENISLSSDSSIEISDDSDDDVEEVEVVAEINKSTNERQVDKPTVEQVETESEENLITIDQNVITIDATVKSSQTEIKPSPQEVINPSPQEEINPSPQEEINPSPQEEINPSPQEEINPSPQEEINPSPQEEINPPPQNDSNSLIHEAPTQAAFNISNETCDDDERPLSMEVSYDYPNTGSETVTILDKEDGDNLPSTNDTDDIQITCGQVMKPSQEMSDKVASGIDETETKMNGINIDVEEVVENGHDVDKNEENNLQNGIVNIEPLKVSNKNDGVSVDDMLADFVDEVNEEANVG